MVGSKERDEGSEEARTRILDAAQALFAAHGFREVDRLSQSINYFRKSAELTSKPEWKNRCYTRAYGIAQITGDKQTAENCRKQIQNFSSPENSAPLPQSN